MGKLHTLYVDLDGTLIKTDILLESVLLLIKHNLFYIFIVPLWLIKGKSNLKYKISSLVDINPKTLPYNIQFLSFLQKQNKLGRKLVLATATTEKYAQSIASYLNIFHEVIASTPNKNISGRSKLKVIQSYDKDFSYAGNATVDMVIFSQAKESIIVNPTYSLKTKISKLNNITHNFPSNTNILLEIFKTIRVHQWVKNILIFIPIIMDQQFNNIDLLSKTVIAFFSFSLFASATYIINDLFDIPHDRAHKTKKNRPLASGNLSIPVAIITMILLIISSLFLAVSIEFIYGLAFYFILTVSYSFVLKRYILIDAMSLAVLYTVRIFIGALVINSIPSVWLISFSMFIFLSLALVKRCSELLSLDEGKTHTPGRDYSVQDIYILSSMGIASGFVSVLVIVLYLNDIKPNAQYTYPEFLWLVCPPLFYWIGRMWIKTFRNEMNDDPIIFTVKDKASLICISSIFCIIVTSILL